MEPNFKQSLFKYFNFTKKDWEITEQYFNLIELKAKEPFLTEGKISNRIGVVESGLLRSFFYGENGNEITTRFFIPGSLVISVVSFTQQKPAKESILTIEPTELVIFTHKDFQELLKKVPAWQQIPLVSSEYMNRQKEKRILEFQTMPAKERYLKFLDKYPQVCRSATVGQIASYLGIDIATLSRIRKNV